MNMLKVSVIMGFHNNKNNLLLEKNIDSIINQTFDDWEFLICNDGSIDDTLSQLERIAEEVNRITLLSYEQNKGLNYALNTCLQQVKDEYIARRDADISKVERLQMKITFWMTIWGTIRLKYVPSFR